jgi:hypothetical protein
MSMNGKAAYVLKELLRASLLFSSGSIVGLATLVALFKLGVAAGIDILFYRGLVLCAVALLLTVALVAYVGQATHRASLRDAIAAGFLSLGINLSVLVIAPVTVDRSLSIFILGHMARHAGETFTASQIDAALRDIYLGQFRQVERRMQEQLKSGNVAQDGDGYTISRQGLAFIRTARLVGWMFDVDPRFVEGPARPQLSKLKCSDRVGVACPRD